MPTPSNTTFEKQAAASLYENFPNALYGISKIGGILFENSCSHCRGLPKMGDYCTDGRVRVGFGVSFIPHYRKLIEGTDIH